MADGETKKLSRKEMVKNIIHCFTVVSDKQSVRKLDIIERYMNRQAKDFEKVIVEVKSELLTIFGFRLIGLKNGSQGEESLVVCEVGEATSFFTINKYRHGLAALASDESLDVKKVALLILLSTTYMYQTLDEGAIWFVLEEMGLIEKMQHLCKGREDLRRFLKAEFVDSLFLARCFIKDPNGTEEDTVKYGWGIRAELEFCKYGVLQIFCQGFGKKPEDLPEHLARLSLEKIEEINEEMEALSVNTEAKVGTGTAVDNGAVVVGTDTVVNTEADIVESKGNEVDEDGAKSTVY